MYSIKLVVIHPIRSDKKLNYHPHHYSELLRKQQPFRSNEELEQQTQHQLMNLSGLGFISSNSMNY